MKIGIISLGLIGGSILKCLSNKDFEIFVVSRNEKTLEKARKYRAIASNELSNVKNCEIIFVCSPIDKTLEMLDKLELIISKKTIVLDCASIKEFIMQKERIFKFIGSHPMAGTENSGFDAGFKELFEGAKWALIPQKNVSETDLKKVKSIIHELGATAFECEAKEHDLAVAMISHMPMFLSQALFETINNNELAKHLASSGFRDMTRLAMTNTEMAYSMLKYNENNILSSYKALKNNIEKLKSNNYKEKIKIIAENRKKMYSKEGKNIYE